MVPAPFLWALTAIEAASADQVGEGEADRLDAILPASILEIGMSLTMVSSASADDLTVLQVVPLLGVELGVERQFGHADDAVHRRADLVAHVGQEGAAGAVGRFRRLLAAMRSASDAFSALMSRWSTSMRSGSPPASRARHQPLDESQRQSPPWSACVPRRRRPARGFWAWAAIRDWTAQIVWHGPVSASWAMLSSPSPTS